MDVSLLDIAEPHSEYSGKLFANAGENTATLFTFKHASLDVVGEVIAGI